MDVHSNDKRTHTSYAHAKMDARKCMCGHTHNLRKTALTHKAVAPLLLQDLTDVPHAADRELVVVELVP